MRFARSLSLAALISFGGCEFAVKHPPATAAIVGGSLALATCEIGTDFEGAHKECAVISLGTAVVLGMITFLAIAVGGKGATVLGSVEAVEPEREVPQDPTLDQPQDPTPDLPAEQPVDQPPAPPPVLAPTPAPQT